MKKLEEFPDCEIITRDDVENDIGKAIQIIEVYLECSWGYFFEWRDFSDEFVKQEALRLLDDLQVSAERSSQKAELGGLH